MCGRASVLRILVTASVLCSFAAPASAAGMGGFSMGGMGVGMVGVGGVANAAGAAAGAVNMSSASAAGNRDHLPIGASDGPSGLSASSGHDPFGNSKASSAWASLPRMDPDLPGVVAPQRPSVAKSGPPAPDPNVEVPVTAERQNNSFDVNSGSQGGAPAVHQRSFSSSEAPGAPRR
jgi:hypothetical protein